MSDAFDSVLSGGSKGEGGGASMTMDADGVPRIVISGTSADVPADPFAAVLSGAPAPAAAPASAPATPAGESIGSRLLRVGREVVDPVGAALGIDYGKAATGIASGFADLGSSLIGRMKESVSGLPDSPIVPPQLRTPGKSLSNLVTGQAPQSPMQAEEAARRASLEDFNKEQASGEGGGSFQLGRVGGNIAATYPIGAGLAGVVPSAFGIAAARTPFAASVSPLLQRAASVPYLGPVVRAIPGMADAAVQGYAQAAAVDPSSAGTAAAISAATPPVVNAATRGGGAVANMLRSMMASNDARDAASILRAAGYAREDIPDLLKKISFGSTDGAGVPLASHQILYDPARPETAGLSQLARNLINAGNTDLLGVANAQNAARHGVLNAIAPRTGTLQDAAADFGNAAHAGITEARADTRTAIGRAFENVDPSGESRFFLPLAEMQAVLDKFYPLGQLKGGSGGAAHSLMQSARSVGTDLVDYAPQTAEKIMQSESTLAKAVRQAGGINAGNESGKAFAGELSSLRETVPGIVNKGRGQDIDKLAERLHSAGFLPDADPNTLLQALTHEGKTRISNQANMDALYRKQLEGAMGDMPEGKVAIPKALDWRGIQQLRSTLGDAIRKIENGGQATTESQALREMKQTLDNHVADVSEGMGTSGEAFAYDAAKRYKDAIAMKRAEVDKFGTGPQAYVNPQTFPYRGSLAQQFYNSSPSQVGTMEAFGRVETPMTRSLLRNYAVQGMRDTESAQGNLTTKLGDFLEARSGANRLLFTPDELARLDATAAGIHKTTVADAANIAKGSPTAQNVQTAMDAGLWGSPLVKGLASKTPGVKHLAVPIVEKLGEATKQAKAARLGTLMSDPAALADAMAALERVRPVDPVLGADVTPQLLRYAAPALLGGAR